MNKTIAFFVRDIAADKLPFSSRDFYYYGYQQRLLAMKALGAQAYFVTDNATYLGKGRFSQAWSIDKISAVEDFQPVGEITAGVVFDKGGFEGTDVPVVTDHRLHSIMSDKALIYEKFGRYQPKTVVCANTEELTQAIKDMPGSMIVIKGPEGTGGKRVYIGEKSNSLVPDTETYPLLVQEFIDMSGGIPGLADGPHDVRVLMIGNEILGATLRQPAPGRLHSNVSQGGSERLLSVDEIPEELKTMARQIDSELEDLPRYYGADFARGKDGWVLIEINKKPGFFLASNGPLAPLFIDRLAHYLIGLA